MMLVIRSPILVDEQCKSKAAKLERRGSRGWWKDGKKFQASLFDTGFKQ